MKNKTKMTILFFVTILLLAGCSSFPKCPLDMTCTILSAEESITIPLILPLTSPNPALIEEQKQAIQFSFLNTLRPSTYKLEIYDNYDLNLINDNQILSLLENPNMPLILSSLSHNSKNKSSAANSEQIKNDFGNPMNVYADIPGIYYYIDQALISLSDYLSTNTTVLLTSYQHFETFNSTPFCTDQIQSCFPFDITLFDESVQETIKNAQVVILASNLQDIQEWMPLLTYSANQKFILFDTNFSRPSLSSDNVYGCFRFSVEMEIVCQSQHFPENHMYWLLPELWFEDELAKVDFVSDQKWEYALSYWAYLSTQPIFEILQTSTSLQKNGFRNIEISQLHENIPKQIKPPEVSFKLYQFRNSSYIIKTNLN